MKLRKVEVTDESILCFGTAGNRAIIGIRSPIATIFLATNLASRVRGPREILSGPEGAAQPSTQDVERFAVCFATISEGATARLVRGCQP
jgi:hypothetical protein